VKVNIHQAYLMAPFGEHDGEIGGNATLAYAAFSAHDQDLVFDMGQTFLYFNILLVVLFLFAAHAACLTILRHLTVTSSVFSSSLNVILRKNSRLERTSSMSDHRG
jgi:hypothetical protein